MSAYTASVSRMRSARAAGASMDDARQAAAYTEEQRRDVGPADKEPTAQRRPRIGGNRRGRGTTHDA